MLVHLLIIAGVLIFGVALRSFDSRAAIRLGTLCLLGASFLAGWLLLGSVLAGFAGLLCWLLLPWVDLVFRVRHLRMPIERQLEGRLAPNRENFPGLAELTSEFEEAGFEQIDDSGWKWESSDHFLRTFYRTSDRVRATICLVQQDEYAFAFTTLMSRRRTDRKRFITWDYPFSYSLSFPPDESYRRCTDAESFEGLAMAHDAHLRAESVTLGDLCEIDPEETHREMESEMTAQMRYNLSTGLLRIDEKDEAATRYSWKGLFFLWWQLLKEIVRPA